MNRRRFIKRIGYSGAGAMMLGGVPVNVLAANDVFNLAAAAGNTDKVLVFIQLHGGNDALNTVVPVSQYNKYYNLRPNIALPDSGTRSFINVDKTIDEALQVGLHPDMIAIKEMYDQGKVVVVQNVGYPDMNLSHFRGRDIVFMGGGPYDNYESGWMGRFLDHEYPGYPDSYPSTSMPDPIGIELSGTLSLAFHRENGIPIGLNVGSPENFYDLINSVGVNAPYQFPDTHAGDELEYIMQFEKKSNQYAERLKQVYDAGSNSSVVYPEAYPNPAPESDINNPLSGQLRLIARLLKGGIKTRIFLVRMGGFDTHGEQVDRSDSTYGLHAALLYHLSTAVKAFYDDMAALGVDDKVLSMTFTEFGRRAYSNASYGTDHGTSTPVFLFGKGLNPGVYGQNPDLDNLKNGNLVYNVDYRQIYTTVVQDWFGANNEAMAQTGFSDWIDKKLPLIPTTGVDVTPYRKNRGRILLYPNPVQSDLSVEFFLKNHGDYTLRVFNDEGRELLRKDGFAEFGKNSVLLNGLDWPAGKYVVQVKSQKENFVDSFIKL
jgi:uncharacterized protein (DUF1501 family)